ncbi:hypothetical protein QVD17_26041 [Tagetes erecta]|uniref:Exocyst subunit Exo70 family protein n=1 Tax=Tagetes erecta TaxID=13708 RepID=A0AAD8KA58_TARER|nr:hypothetical protein QVD17_26041 [Tagetes erecta]
MTIDSATEIIYRWGSTADLKLFIFDNCRDEIVPFLQAMDEIQQTIDSTGSEDERKEAESVIQIAVSRLVKEFHNILKVNAKVFRRMNNLNAKRGFMSSGHNSFNDSTTMSDSSSSNIEVYEDDHVKRNTLSTEAINDLRSIAVRMNSCGFIHECLKVYVSERKSGIEARLRHMDIEKLSRDSCRRLEWAVLKPKIKVLIRAAIICFRYYFVNEKQLCDQIFHGLGDKTTDSCFMDTVTDHTIQLFDNAEALCSIPPASERLFKILDLHRALFDLIPWIQSLEFLSTKAINQTIPKLADKANEIFRNFEKSLVNEKSPVFDHAEPIHSLSKYVLNYVYKLCDHKITLMRLSLPNLPFMDVDGNEATSFSAHVDWIIMRLVSNLEDKSKLCKDPPASCFFAMNNFHFIIQEIHAHPELQRNVSYDNFMSLSGKFKHARSEYLKLTLNVVLRSLRDEGLNKIKILSFSFRVSKMIYRLKRFNHGFEKLQKDLGKLVVSDHELVAELRRLVAETVVPAYTLFLLHTKKGARLEAHLKYSVEEIEFAIQKFFHWSSCVAECPKVLSSEISHRNKQTRFHPSKQWRSLRVYIGGAKFFFI